MALQHPPKPEGEPGEFFSITEGWTVWDRHPGSLRRIADRFALYDAAGQFVGVFSEGFDAEREAAFRLRPIQPFGD